MNVAKYFRVGVTVALLGSRQVWAATSAARAQAMAERAIRAKLKLA